MSEHNGRTAGVGPGRVLGRSVSQLGSDVITLVELQAALFQVDFRDWSRGMVKAGDRAGGRPGLPAGERAGPVRQPGLSSSTKRPNYRCALSMLIAAGVGLAHRRRLRGRWACGCLNATRRMFHRFKGELKQNVNWLKQVLRNPNRRRLGSRPLGAPPFNRSYTMPIWIYELSLREDRRREPILMGPAIRQRTLRPGSNCDPPRPRWNSCKTTPANGRRSSRCGRSASASCSAGS